MARNLPETLKAQIRQRAEGLCEYCHAVEKWQFVCFTIDHILPKSQGGTDSLDNLALACFHCNRKKYTKNSAIDPDTGIETALFNPRRDRWQDHFAWANDKLYLLGITPTGRATVNALECNRDRLISIRVADIAINRHPPENDPIQSLI
ncbi:HNH nuclease domain-containing protein [Tumidithrix helvetica PCC 7403]|uniref:HNH endonuclease n=1 Tax=Tumidithrix helvetica TaxID=3457545 RepID=UPI003CB0CFB4